MSTLGFVLLPSLHGALASSVPFVGRSSSSSNAHQQQSEETNEATGISPALSSDIAHGSRNVEATESQRGQEHGVVGADNDSMWAGEDDDRRRLLQTAELPPPTTTATMAADGLRRRSYAASLSPLERHRFLLWHHCIERIVLGRRRDDDDKDEDVTAVMRSKLFEWCEHASIPAATTPRRGQQQQQQNETASTTTRSAYSDTCTGTNDASTAHAIERQRLSTIRTSAKSVVLLLCDVASPAHIVEGCDYILTELEGHILSKENGTVVEKAEAAVVAALTAYVRTYWVPLVSAPGGDSEERLCVTEAALTKRVDSARRAAVQYLDSYGYQSDYAMSSVKNLATPSTPSPALLDKHALMVYMVGKLAMLRQSLTTASGTARMKGVDCAAAASGVDEAASTCEGSVPPPDDATGGGAVVVAFDVAGALPSPLVTDAIIHLMPTTGTATTTADSSRHDHHLSSASKCCRGSTSIGIPADVALRLHPLRHCRGGTSRASPFAGASSSVALVSVGSRCVLLGPSSRLNVEEAEGTDINDRAALRNGLLDGGASFPITFGCGWSAGAAFYRPNGPSAPHTHTQTAANTTSDIDVRYTDACVLHGLKPYNAEFQTQRPYVAATCGATLDLYNLAESIAFDDRATSVGSQNAAALGGDQQGNRVRDAGARLAYCPLASSAARVPDPTGLSIRSVVGLGFGVAAVGPVVRIINVRDALEASVNFTAEALEAMELAEGNAPAATDVTATPSHQPQPRQPQQQSSVALRRPQSSSLSNRRGVQGASGGALPASASLFLRFQPRATLSARYVLSECVTAATMCGYGAESLVTGRGDEVSVWDLTCGAEVGVVAVNGWLRGQDATTATAEAFVTALHTSFEEHTVAIGTSGGLVALWDVRCKGGAPYSMFRAVPERCGTYRGSCAIRQLRFGGFGARSVFASIPSDAGGAQLRLFRIGYERHPVWQTPDVDCAVARFDVGFVGASQRPFLHMLTSEGSVLGGDVDYLAG